MASFGGKWTEQKLEILRRYLDAYTTALKDQPFRLIYVDAFAGEGSWEPPFVDSSDDYADFRYLRNGSPRIALSIEDKAFDKFVFVEKDTKRFRNLTTLLQEFPDRDIDVWSDDANIAIPRWCNDLQDYDRAVVFLDPFATEVSWSTVARLAATQKVDCWVLFPLRAVARLMPIQREPSDVWASELDRIFGGREHWENLYYESSQVSLFGDARQQEREVGSRLIVNAYRKRMVSSFASVAPTSRILRNSRGAPMFDLIFAASNPKGSRIAVDIADYILRHW